MGWSGGTAIFDDVVESLDTYFVESDYVGKVNLLADLFEVLRKRDWYQAGESKYIEDSLVREAIERTEPDYFGE